ncbi:hypothetical protein ANN_10733 [Periplaneta americana]|uniref:Uncharacterized protein n=1 Tax=Periplaneta americana TaxID=6978 RepID=A0ABQ8T498_PERAM|nr:hypothetical protein ANN_10733 [Periplaneta americana]
MTVMPVSLASMDRPPSRALIHTDKEPGPPLCLRLRWAGYVAHMGEFRNAYRVLVGRPEGKIPLERPRRGWEDNIKMDLREVGYDDREWINLAQDRDLCEGGNEPPGSLEAKCTQWRDVIKLQANHGPVSTFHGRSQENSRGKHCDERETVLHVTMESSTFDKE